MNGLDIIDLSTTMDLWGLWQDFINWRYLIKSCDAFVVTDVMKKITVHEGWKDLFCPSLWICFKYTWCKWEKYLPHDSHLKSLFTSWIILVCLLIPKRNTDLTKFPCARSQKELTSEKHEYSYWWKRFPWDSHL